MQSLDLSRKHGGRGLCDFLGISRGEDVHSPFCCLGIELIDLGQPDSHQDRIYRKCLVGLGDDVPVLVQFRDGNRFDLLLPVCGDHGVAGINRHPEPLEFVRVNHVTPHLGHGLDQGNHMDACLDRMIPGNKPHVSSTHDEDPFGRFDEVSVYKGLECAGPINTGQGIPRKE